jgi:hypothetical protein
MAMRLFTPFVDTSVATDFDPSLLDEIGCVLAIFCPDSSPSFDQAATQKLSDVLQMVTDDASTPKGAERKSLIRLFNEYPKHGKPILQLAETALAGKLRCVSHRSLIVNAQEAVTDKMKGTYEAISDLTAAVKHLDGLLHSSDKLATKFMQESEARLFRSPRVPLSQGLPSRVTWFCCGIVVRSHGAVQMGTEKAGHPCTKRVCVIHLAEIRLAVRPPPCPLDRLQFRRSFSYHCRLVRSRLAACIFASCRSSQALYELWPRLVCVFYVRGSAPTPVSGLSGSALYFRLSCGQSRRLVRKATCSKEQRNVCSSADCAGCKLQVTGYLGEIPFGGGFRTCSGRPGLGPGAPG